MKKTQAQTVKTEILIQSQIINNNTNNHFSWICLYKMLGKHDAHIIPNGGLMVICHGRIHKNITFFLEKIQVFVWVNTLIHGSNVGYVHIQLHKEIGQFQSSPTSKIRMDVSENNGTPKSSILIGFSIINHPFWGTPIFGNTQILSGRACIVSPGGSFEDPSASSTSLPESWESALPKASASSSSWEF